MAMHLLLAITTFLASASAAVLQAATNVANKPGPNPFPEVVGTIPDFEVTGFEAKAIVLSNRNYVNFNVTTYPGGNPAHCFALGTTLDHTLTSIPQTWCHHHKDKNTDSDTYPDNGSDDDNDDNNNDPSSSSTSDPSSPSPTSSTDPSSTTSTDPDATPTPSTDPNPAASGEHVWFSWTMGSDVDDADSPLGSDPTDSVTQTTGAYLKIVRQSAADGQTRDESIRHIPAASFEWQGEGDLGHEVYVGEKTWEMRALRVEAREGS